MEVVEKGRNSLSLIQLYILGNNIHMSKYVLSFLSFILAGRNCPFKKRMGNLVTEFAEGLY